MSEQNFDLVVLGAGSGGYAAALRASQLGLTVGLIEKGKVGGTCLHVGCIPTKALLHAAEVADVTREAAKYGVTASFNGIDIAAVTAYREEIVASKYKGLQGLIKARGITTIEGEGRLTSPTTVQVGDITVTGKNIILATGSYSRSLPGLDIGGRVITSEQALALPFVPQRVAVLGGGVIGVEFSSVWRSWGAEVTIIEALPHLVPNEDESISKSFERAFRKRGIEFKLGVRFQSVTQNDNGVIVTLENGETVEADLLLVAVGRGPSTANLGYEEAGVNMDRGFVLTDERLRTNIPGVWAVGDIVPGLQLAHRGFQQGIFVAEEI
ncbi:MAG TPA: dihydrolipoyl dehydrogenase, partial [Pseudolysinimonas sp.]|nr:dihydrolipoyl dehydrogenase [Pseudolysinimonas sp.]